MNYDSGPEFGVGSVDAHGERSSRREKKSIALSVYRQVWSDFHRWYQKECERLQRTVLRSSNVSAFPQFDLHAVAKAISEIDVNKPLKVIKFDLIEECPTYANCTPTNDMLFGCDTDVNEMTTLSFVPHADDPNFKTLEYLSSFESALWDSLTDPNTEVIQIETAARLHNDFGFSFDEIDTSCHLFPLRIDNESGLIRTVSQRDPLTWPKNPARLPIDTNIPVEADLSSRFHAVDQLFCANLSCITSHCFNHLTRNSRRTSVKPLMTHTSMHRAEGLPCGSFCFRLLDDQDQSIDYLYWSAQEKSDVDTIMDITPDTTPCDLAVLCRKPCREIFSYRRSKYSDEDIADNYKAAQLRRGSGHSRRMRAIAETHASKGPCDHKGACHDQGSGCQCQENQVCCQRTCRCQQDCQLRWRGCRCKGPNTCRLDDCTCWRASRECDPDLCTSCDARRNKHSSCRNVQILHGDVQPIEVKKSSWGFGAFAMSNVAPEALIGEYTGERLLNDLPQNEALPKYMKLNYLFNLNDEYIVDGARAGNETRYINHGDDKLDQTNCIARNKLVNGDHRIGIFASKKIKKGAQLQLDYGPQYWPGSGYALGSSKPQEELS